MLGVEPDYRTAFKVRRFNIHELNSKTADDRNVQ